MGLTSLSTSAFRTIHNVTILNDIYDYNTYVDAGIYNLLYISDTDLRHYVVQTTKEHTENFLARLKDYLDLQDDFSDVFTPGEMQNMANILELYEETYIPVLNEIFDLVEQGRLEEAITVSANRRDPISTSIVYYINVGFTKNLAQSEVISARNNENASFGAYLMLALVFLSLIVSVILALTVTRSIAVPLSALGEAAEKVVKGELNVLFEQSQSSDEIARLSLRLQETMQHLNQVQQLKLEAMEARHEKEKAEAASKSKGDFLARMSHEIRTPMNAITGMAELALRDEMPNAAREHILTIKQAGANLLSIINNILDFSKIESGNLEIFPADYLFSSLLNDVISIIRMRVIDSQINFVVNVDSNIPNALIGDETRIRQVLLNILSNAVKFTEKGFVSLVVTGVIKDGAVVLSIEVADSGKGIKKENIKKLFSEFIQIDMTSNVGIEGTGLGLAISKSIVKAMDGSISVESEFGVGSIFTVTLPQRIRDGKKLASVNDPGNKRVLVYECREIYTNSIVCTVDNLGVDCIVVTTDEDFYKELARDDYSFVFIASNLYERVRKAFSGLKPDVKIVLLTEFGEAAADNNLYILSMPVYSIPVANVLNGVSTASTFVTNKEAPVRFIAPAARVMVVDDIYTNLKVAEGLLLPYKMQVELCISGQAAIDAIKSKTYDLVFMDHMMPDMDGIETTTVIRDFETEQAASGRIPIVALTANVVSGMKEMFIEKGFDDFLAKPIDISKLDEILDRWIPREKRESEKLKIKNEKLEEGKGRSELPIITGVDVKKGIAMTGGTMGLYRQVLALFCKDAEERLPLLKAVLGAKEPSGAELSVFTTQVHALKSASASIGAAELSAGAAGLEEAGRSTDMAFIRENLPAFVEHLAELVKSIGIALQEPSIPQSPVPSPNSQLPTPRSLFNELATALESQNASEIDRVLEELSQKQLDPKTKEALEKISDLILMTEFDNAIKLIDWLTGTNRDIS